MTVGSVDVILESMIDDVGIAVIGLGLFCLIFWLFVIEPRSGVHPDH